MAQHEQVVCFVRPTRTQSSVEASFPPYEKAWNDQEMIYDVFSEWSAAP